MVYRLYSFITSLLHYVLPVFLKRRILQNKEDDNSYKEKICLSFAKHKKGELIWFHASSIGELNSIIPLVSSLGKKHKILITTITITSREIFYAKGLSKNIIHQMLPLDTPQLVDKFLAYFQPKLAVFTESELWPNYLHKIQCPMILLNARMSDKSFYLWKFLSSLIKPLLKKFDVILPSTEEDQIKFQHFSKDNIEYIGNLKYTAPALSYKEQDLLAVSNLLKGREVWLCASTHNGEEKAYYANTCCFEKRVSKITDYYYS